MIGYEIEFFVIDNETKQPITGAQFDRIHVYLAKNGWKNHRDGLIGGGLDYSKKGDIALKTDVVLHIFELNMPPCVTVGQAQAEFEHTLREVDEAAKQAGAMLLMIGGFPTKIKHTERTRGNDGIIYELKLGERMADWYVIAGNHVWLDVQKERLVETTNLFNSLSGILIALFGNSSVIEEEIQPNIEQRSPHPERGTELGFTFGIPKKPYTRFLDYLELLIESPFYFLFDNDGICFYLGDRKLTYFDYFSGKQRNVVRVDGKEYERAPTITDLEEVARRNFIEMRPKYRFRKSFGFDEIFGAYLNKDESKMLGMLDKTFLEIRTPPCSRLSEIPCAPTFALGLQNNLEAVKRYVEKRPHSFWQELRIGAIRHGLNFMVDRVHVSKLAKELVDLSKEGLVARNHGEEKYLERIYVRIEQRENLGQENLRIFKRGGLEKLIEANLLK